MQENLPACQNAGPLAAIRLLLEETGTRSNFGGLDFLTLLYLGYVSFCHFCKS